MSTPNRGMLALLADADSAPLSKLIRDHGRPLIADAASQELIYLDGTNATMRWALYRADGNTQAGLKVHLTDTGRDHLEAS
jgi:hypothetical protein